MSDQDFTFWLLAIFAGLMVVLGLIVWRDKAYPNRSELNDVLLRNGSEFDHE